MEVNIVQKNGSNKQKLTGKTNNRWMYKMSVYSLFNEALRNSDHTKPGKNVNR
jgi:hypothetical protein